MIVLYLLLRVWWGVLVAQPDSHLVSQCKLHIGNINSKFHSDFCIQPNNRSHCWKTPHSIRHASRYAPIQLVSPLKPLSPILFACQMPNLSYNVFANHKMTSSFE